MQSGGQSQDRTDSLLPCMQLCLPKAPSAHDARREGGRVRVMYQRPCTNAKGGA